VPTTCDLILPCRNEAAALPGVLSAVPPGLRPIVVDNGSTDATADVAAGLGATLVSEDQPGYGAAVQAGLEHATAELVAVMDADGSMDPADLLPLIRDVASGSVAMSVGVRRPTADGGWPWHARFGNRAVLALLHRRGVAAHDIAAMRVCRREGLLALGVQDRRFGYPLELLVRAHEAGWTVGEHPIAYGPRAPGTRSKISGSVRGTVLAAFDFVQVLR